MVNEADIAAKFVWREIDDIRPFRTNGLLGLLWRGHGHAGCSRGNGAQPRYVVWEDEALSTPCGVWSLRPVGTLGTLGDKGEGFLPVDLGMRAWLGRRFDRLAARGMATMEHRTSADSDDADSSMLHEGAERNCGFFCNYTSSVTRGRWHTTPLLI